MKTYLDYSNYKFHFTPPRGWMNDPNGMIYIDGTYHLFYQYYPYDTKWGPMHWGHAISLDLINFEHVPIALCPDDEYIFSGSCVYDSDNVSGLAKDGRCALLAFYTGHNKDNNIEKQCVAYSYDFIHFHKYDKNPIIDNAVINDDGITPKNDDGIDENQISSYKKDFRDPKVFKNPVKGGFSMALAVGNHIEFYHSNNLLNWKYTGEFKPYIYGYGGICECPDCIYFEAEDKWVLSMSMICDSKASNPRLMQYFIGEFDGYTFAAYENEYPLCLDYGFDNYAMVSFSNCSDIIMIGWGENWEYINSINAINNKCKMTIPRRVSLVKAPLGYRIRQEIFSSGIDRQKIVIANGDTHILRSSHGQLEISNSNSKLIFKRTTDLLEDTDEDTDIDEHPDEKIDEKIDEKTDEKSGEKTVDETRNVLYDERMNISVVDRCFTGACELLIVEDNGYYEIFADDGLIVASIQI